MIEECHAIADFWQQWQPTAERIQHRQNRLAATIGWTESPTRPTGWAYTG